MCKTTQHDLDTALRRTTCLGGIDEALFEANEKDINAIFSNDHDWIVYAQYAAGMLPTSLYCERNQSSKAVFHLELVWVMSCLEGLSRPYFAMGENLSEAVGNRGANLINPQINQLVKKTVFELMKSMKNLRRTSRSMTCLRRLNVHNVQPTACWV